MTTTPDFITSTLLAEPGLRHGFFTRRGGVSQGVYDSLNCALAGEDNPVHTIENRARATHALGMPVERLVSAYQVHSADVATITAPLAAADRPRADALVTTVPGLTLGVLTADCTPVLLADPVAGVIAAAHSGWKGTLGNIVANTVARMEALGASRSNLRASIGPCIAQISYEVGPEFPEPFLQQDAALLRFFTPATKAGHWQFDLRGMVGAQLAALGIATETLPHDTYANERDFFSNRRKTHRGEYSFGLQLSAIALLT